MGSHRIVFMGKAVLRSRIVEKGENKHDTRNKKICKRSSTRERERKRKSVPKTKSGGFTRPFEIGFYSPGNAPDRIPYHLYLLVKKAVDLMNDNSSIEEDLIRVEKKISFFCDFFYSHLPLGWKYHRINAASLIAGCDAFFAKGGPKYNLSGFTPPLEHPVDLEFDYETKLVTTSMFDIMWHVHSRTPHTPETFVMDACYFSFYCKLCSCFGIDYQHPEAASEDDVILMKMGSAIVEKSRRKLAFCAINKRYTISYNNNNPDDNYIIKHMRKLSSHDEAFELSLNEIYHIFLVIRSRRLPPVAKFTEWNEYQRSFYFKVCTCLGIHLPDAAA